MKCTSRYLWVVGLAALVAAVPGCGDDDDGGPVTPTNGDPTVTLTAPAGGVAVDPGSVLQIAWQAEDDGSIESVDLSYKADGSSQYVSIVGGLTGVTTYDWTVPSGTLFGVQVRVTVTDDGGKTAEDVSAVFAVVLASERGYVTSQVCGSCHADYLTDLLNSGHPYKINKVVGGQPPTYPHSEVPDPPAGFSWNDITYVIGGYGWKARFINSDGYIITDGVDGVNGQYNLPRDDLGGGISSEWVAYEPDQVDPKPYNCGRCHTTGWQSFADNGGVHQDGLAGMDGTWEETGVGCEACHGAGATHVATKSAANITIDTSAELCGSCHFRDSGHRILASGGFIKHHEQFDEMMSAGHAAIECDACHEPHKGTRYGNADAGGIIASCESCHPDQAAHIAHNGVPDCIDCHMSRASKSARKLNDFNGDVRTHIFKINTDPVGKDSMFFDDNGSTVANGFVTLDFACYGCHKDPNTGQGGNFSEKSLETLSDLAKVMHNN